ncbi:uncharacterized protein L969DRAFT_66338 [Mixia osmundae IAM 14324]|uniref:NADH:flavin oxidoreductase/NADH oxidase N-terminal domain-containing protein n=1 Tax=Mixia osmundae (strain CBS 9802 / IAM 14324 / JCM 22182 / KY 12970) TaxID=764103 RepID=G7EB15_MIXOS|nr:uncharacterized protein L969DRAFT_66338 [Mixia osmundae IAM 14324]KEI37060.1 hypothetical protein L969DRAFT_66338 [Mixia osmundae IAM 14324]GAB00026.1 hypothetical protein E5Q_06728 [Mixia osmundae IAM 14324]
MGSSKLFTPMKVGPLELKHRVIMAPLTRFRATTEHVHTELATEYYTQRASVPGTLLFTEATFISPQAGGNKCVPGIWNEPQIKAWKDITDAVHAKESYIGCQLWALGRQAEPSNLNKEGPYPYVSASDVALPDKPKPRALTKDEIETYVADYAQAAVNARKAGFDLVELHSANGYLPNQFISKKSNIRTDEYGGSLENRLRFPKQCLSAIVDKIGQERTGIRLSPFSTFGDMSTDQADDYIAFIEWIRDTYPSLAYLHVVESRISGNADVDNGESTDPMLHAWRVKDKTRPFLTAGGYKADSGKQVADVKDVAVVYGRYFISNPDLPLRLAYDRELQPYDRSTFYLFGPSHARGYTDQPFDESLKGKTISARL